MKNWVRNFHIQEILCLAVMVVIAIAMLSRFTDQNRTELQKLVEKNVLQDAETCSARVTAVMDQVTGAVTVADRVLESSWQMNEETIDQMLTVIPESCESYLAVYCKLDGTARTSGGEELDLKESGYFSKLQGSQPYFLYVEDDGVTGSEAILYVHPVIRTQAKRGYLLAFLSKEFPLAAIQGTVYEERAFFTITDWNGKLHTTFGDTEGTKFLVDDFWANLRSYIAEGEDWKQAELLLNTDRVGSIRVDADGEKRLICVAPMEGTAWYFVMGLEESYVDGLVENVWNDNGRFQIWICVVLLAILGVMVLFSARNRQRSEKESRQLENKADTDLLTGLNNKIATERKITEYMQNNKNSQAMMVVLDVDNFKKINDTMGHGFGDEVLRNLGFRLASLFRTTDILGRLGGDEFVLLLKDIQREEDIQKEARKLEDFFHQFEVGEHVKYSVTASLGAAVFPRDADTFEGMYKAADAALYTAKRRGKNQLAFYEKNGKKEPEKQ